MSWNLSVSRHHAALAAILLLTLLLTLGYSVINPLFEAPDEHFHFFTLNEIATHGRLPTIPDAYDEYLGPEPAQPPLYYLLGALIAAPFDTAAARQQVPLNPFAWIGSADAVVNLNRTIITPWELWPWQGYALAAHLIRAFSTLLGLGTLLCIHASARLLWPDDGRPALLATALIAFLPQFNFIHAAITNDTLITLLASAAVWQLLRLWQTAVTRRRLLALGVTIGLAALAKNAGVLLLLYALGVLFLLALRDYDPETGAGRYTRRRAGQTAVFVILPVLLIAGWLWLRNQMLYGDFTAANQFIAIAGGDRGYTVWQVLAESGGLWRSFFAVFGWFNLLAPPWVYAVWNGVAMLATVGLLHAVAVTAKNEMAAIRSAQTEKEWSWLLPVQRLLRRPWLPGLLLLLWLLAVYAGLVAFMLQTEAAQGRLLFPALTPIALGLAYGLTRLRLTVVPWLAAAAALATTAACLFFVIAPTYARPQTIDALPPAAAPLQAEMDHGISLVGARVETETAVPGDVLWFTLYWQLARPTTAMPAFKFELLGRDLDDPIGDIHTFHGRGLYPPNLWPAGPIIADRFPVRLEQTIDAPVLARGFARLVPVPDTGSDDAKGVAVGAVKVTPAVWPPAGPPLAQLGDAIALTAVSLPAGPAAPGDVIPIDVTWHATGAPGRDYATLVHLAPAGQPPLAQGDAHPRGGAYPTRVWAAGEVIADRYTLPIPADLPAGCYPVWIGMYAVADGTRLPLTVDGQRQPNDVYRIDDLCVERS